MRISSFSPDLRINSVVDNWIIVQNQLQWHNKLSKQLSLYSEVLYYCCCCWWINSFFFWKAYWINSAGTAELRARRKDDQAHYWLKLPKISSLTMKTIRLKWHLAFFSPIPNRPYCVLCVIACISEEQDDPQTLSKTFAPGSKQRLAGACKPILVQGSHPRLPSSSRWA